MIHNVRGKLADDGDGFVESKSEWRDLLDKAASIC